MTARLAERNISKGRLTAISEQIGYRAIELFHPVLDRKLIDTNVIEIVQRALELDIEMSKQKAALFFSYLGYSLQYDPERMSIDHEQVDGETVPKSSWNVDVFVAPALCKNDPSDSETDATQFVLMAVEVLCSPQKVHRTASPQHKPRASSPQQIHRVATMPARPTNHPSRSSHGFDVTYAKELEGGYRYTS